MQTCTQQTLHQRKVYTGNWRAYQSIRTFKLHVHSCPASLLSCKRHAVIKFTIVAWDDDRYQFTHHYNMTDMSPASFERLHLGQPDKPWTYIVLFGRALPAETALSAVC